MSGDQHQQPQPQQQPKQAPPQQQGQQGQQGQQPNGNGTAAPGNADAEKEAAFQRALAAVTTEWKAVCGDLLKPGELAEAPFEVSKFKHDAYQLIARRDGAGVAGLLGVKAALAIYDSRKQYADALARAEADANMDAAHRAGIHECLQDLEHGGDIQYNSNRVVAHFQMTSTEGRAWWKSDNAVEWVAAYAAYLTDYTTLGRHAGAIMPWMTEHNEALAKNRAAQLLPLLTLIKTGALGAQADAAPVPETVALPDKDTKDKWKVAAEALKKELDHLLPKLGATGKEVRAEVDKDRNLATQAITKIDAQPVEVRDIVAQDTTFMRRVALLGDNVQHYKTGQDVQTIFRALDPVEALFDEVSGAQIHGNMVSRPLAHTEGSGVKNDEHVKVGKARFERIEQFLLEHVDPTNLATNQPLRLRVMTRDRMLETLSETQKADLWKVATRGTLAPSIEDKLYPAMKSGDAAAVAGILLHASGEDRIAIAKLQTDVVFRNSIADDKMHKPVTVDGVSVIPYDMMMLMWGQKAGDTRDPGQNGAVESDPNNESKPLNFDERATLDNGLYNPVLEQLKSDFDAWSVSDSDVTKHLNAFASKCAEKDYKDLIRRAGTPPGQELATRYNARTGNSIDHLLKKHCAEDCRRTAERILNITLDSASVGVIGGVGARAGETPNGAVIGLEQALRETATSDGRTVSQCVHDTAAKMKWELHPGWTTHVDPDAMRGYFRALDAHIDTDGDSKLKEIETLTKRRVHTIELVQNAYMEIDGSLSETIKDKARSKDVANILSDLGLDASGIAKRQEEAITAGDAKPADKNQVARESAETLYGTPAKELFEALAFISGDSTQQAFANARAKREQYQLMKGTASPDNQPPDLDFGSGTGVAKNAIDYYRITYGLTPENHAVQIARSFKHVPKKEKKDDDDKEPPPPPTPREVAEWLGVRAELVEGAVQAPPADQKPVVDDHNKLLVRPEFTEQTATSIAQQMWEVLHGGGEVHLIETTLYGQWNDEEQRLIRLAFRQLSGGIDWQFYVQQAKFLREHQAGMGTAYGDTHQTFVGGEGTEAGKLASGDQIKVTANAGELDTLTALSQKSDLSINDRLRSTISHSNVKEILRIVDGADEAQCKQVMADQALMDKLQSFLTDYHAGERLWDRVYRTLTGSDDLATNLETRTHGDYDHWWSRNIGHGTDKEAMKQDIRDYIQRMRDKIEQEEVAKARTATPPPSPEELAATISRRIDAACKTMSNNTEVNAIINDELSGMHAATARGILINQGRDSNVAALAGGGDADDIIAEIKRMPQAERQRRLADPEYMKRLTTKLTKPADLEAAVSLLQSDAKDAPPIGGPPTPGEVQDKLADLAKQLANSPDRTDVLKTLVDLSQAEHQRLVSDPALVAKLTNLFRYGSESQRAIVEQFIAYDKSQAEDKLGHEIVYPDAPTACAGRTIPVEEQQRLAFLQESAVARLLGGADRNWDNLLRELVEVYKMDFKPRGIYDLTPQKKDPNEAQEDPNAKASVVPEKPVGPPIDPNAELVKSTESALRQGVWARVQGKLDIRESRVPIARAAVLHEENGDPSAERIDAADKWYSTDRDTIAETVTAASDDLVLKHWTSIITSKADGSDSYAKAFSAYLSAKQKAGGEKPEDSPEQKDLHDAKLHFMSYVIDSSTEFERDVLTPVSSKFWSGDDDQRSTEKPKQQDFTKERSNEHYLKVQKILRDRIVQMRRDKTAMIAELIGATDKDDIALIETPNAEVAQGLQFRTSEYLRKFGTNSGGMRVAEAERGAVHDSLQRYEHDSGVAESKDNKDGGYGVVSKEDAAKAEKEGQDFDRALKDFSAARAQIASIAGAIVGLIVGAVLTVMTGGAGAGLAWMLVAGAISGAAAAAGNQLMQKSIKGSEFDNVEGIRAVAHGAVEGMVMAGTMKVAESIMSSLFVAKELRAQGKAFAEIVSADKSWGALSPLINNAKIAAYTGGEMAIASGLNQVVDAGLAPLDPALWVHGWSEGVHNSKHVISEKLDGFDQNLLRSFVTGVIMHGGGMAHKAIVGERPQIPPYPAYGVVLTKLERLLDPMRVKNNALRYLRADEQMVQAFASYVSNKFMDRVQGKVKGEINWDAVPDDAFEEFVGALNGLSTSVITGHYRPWQETHGKAPNEAPPRAKSRDEELKANGDRMTDAEKAHYKALHPDSGTDTTISADDYLAARHYQFKLAVAEWEARLHHPMSEAEKAEYEKWCRDAKDSADYELRLRTNPLEVPSVKAIASANPKPVDPNKPVDPKQPDEKPPVTADEAAKEKGAVPALDGTSFDGKVKNDADPDKIREQIARAIPLVAGEFPPGTVVAIDAHTLAVHVGDQTLVVQVRTMAAENSDLARYQMTGPESAVIEISDRVRDKHVERALADLVAEIQAQREADIKGKPLPKESALAPGSTRVELSAQDLGRIAQLRALMRQIDAVEHPPSGQKNPVAVEQLTKDLDQLLQALGLKGDAGAERMEKVLGSQMTREELNALIVRGDNLRREAAAEKLPPHSGTELHNHFLGIVDPKTFADTVAAKEQSKLKPGETLTKSPWELTLDQIATKMDQHAHKTKDGATAERGQDFEKRGVSGDAIALAKETVKALNGEPFEAKHAPEWLISGANELKAAKAELKAAKEGNHPDAEVARLEKLVADKKAALAEAAVRAALTATEETDFNSSYEIRDELIKANFGGPKVDELTKQLQAEQAKPDSPEKTARIAELQKLIGQAPYEAFARDTVRALIQDGLTYNEQSNSLKKLNEKFPKEMMDRVIWEVSAQMVAEGKITEAQAIQLRNLNMVLTGFFGKEDTRIDEGGQKKNEERDAGKGMFGDESWEKSKKGLEEQYETRSDVVGTDIAGPETAEFDKIGQKRFLELYDLLRKAAISRGRPMVLRPHVGEGFTDTEKGKEFDTKEGKRRGEEAAHYDRARKNLDALLTALESIKLDPEHVIIRFGHATHADATQIERMTKLGIVAEVNLHSNIKTGSLDQLDPQTGKSAPEEQYEDHALLGYIYNGTETILSTDAHSVMDTNMAQEYERSRKIIEDFLGGRAYVEVSKAQFEAHGGKGEAHVVNAGTEYERTEYRLHVGDLNANELSRFTHGYEKLQEFGRNYQAKVAAADKNDKLLWKDLFDLTKSDDWKNEPGKLLHVKDLVRRLAEKNGALDEEALKYAEGIDAGGTQRVRDIAKDLAKPSEMAAQKKDDSGDKGNEKKAETPNPDDQLAAKEAADKGGGKEPPKPPGDDTLSFEEQPQPEKPKADPWKKAEKQGDAIEAAKQGNPTEEQRKLLDAELRSQVPDVALASAVHAGTAKSVVSVVFAGSGEFGIKTMNDKVLGQTFNDVLIAKRNDIVKEVFAKHQLQIVDQSYKSTTILSDKPAAELAGTLNKALAEVDAGMKVALDQVLAQALTFYEKRLADGNVKGPDREAAEKHSKAIHEMQGTLADPKKEFHYDVTAGAADLKTTGKDAKYEDILGAEMDANKAAIVARDAGPQNRAGVFTEPEFKKFCEDTIALRQQLAGQTLSLYGNPREVLKDGKLDRDLFRAMRKGEIERTDANREVFDLVDRYMKRVNALDYLAPFTSEEIAAQSKKLEETQKLLAQLEGDKPISKEASAEIEKILQGDFAQKGAASEAQFYNKAGKLPNRVVLNADIRDLGVRLFETHEGKMDNIATGKESVRAASNTANDDIVQEKTNARNQFLEFYKKLLGDARTLAKSRPDALALETSLANEEAPPLLMGGDGITVSVSSAFDELGLTPQLVAKLNEVANARVSVTHTGSDAVEGHKGAMEKADAGHKQLKAFEELARKLSDRARLLPPDLQAQAADISKKLNELYTDDASGDTVVKSRDGVDPEVLRAQANELINGKPKQTGGGQYGTGGEEALLDDKDPTPDALEIREEALKKVPDGTREEKLNELYKRLRFRELQPKILARRETDLPVVTQVAKDNGVPNASRAAVARVFDYLFNSAGIGFMYENYAAWMRLATGKATFDDIRFLVHELSENKTLEATKEGGKKLDYMGKSQDVGDAAHNRWYENTFEPNYNKAHAAALRDEFTFVAAEIHKQTGLTFPIEELAAVDPVNLQAREYMPTADGTTLVKDSPQFQDWQTKGAQPVKLTSDVLERLGLQPGATLPDLIKAIKGRKVGS